MTTDGSASPKMKSKVLKDLCKCNSLLFMCWYEYRDFVSVLRTVSLPLLTEPSLDECSLSMLSPKWEFEDLWTVLLFTAPVLTFLALEVPIFWRLLFMLLCQLPFCLILLLRFLFIDWNSGFEDFLEVSLFCFLITGPNFLISFSSFCRYAGSNSTELSGMIFLETESAQTVLTMHYLKPVKYSWTILSFSSLKSLISSVWPRIPWI